MKKLFITLSLLSSINVYAMTLSQAQTKLKTMLINALPSTGKEFIISCDDESQFLNPEDIAIIPDKLHFKIITICCEYDSKVELGLALGVIGNMNLAEKNTVSSLMENMLRRVLPQGNSGYRETSKDGAIFLKKVRTITINRTNFEE